MLPLAELKKSVGPYILANAHVITQTGLTYANGAVAIENELIIAVGNQHEVVSTHDDFPVYDCRGQLLMPGFICAHGHFYGMFSRGMDLQCEPPANFKDVLDKLWWRLDKALDETAVRLSAEVLLIDAIRFGTTTIFDHHASPQCIPGSLTVVAEACKRAGVRASLCYEVTQRNGEEECEAGIAENADWCSKASSFGDIAHQFHGLTGMHAPLTCDTVTVRKCVDVGHGVHVHVSESRDDGIVVAEREKKRVIPWLNECGATGPQSIFAHCVHVPEEDFPALASTETWVIHNPESNMNNAVGISDVPAMLRAGVKVCLGTDGMSMDMIQSRKSLYLLHKLGQEDPRVMGSDADVILFQHNAEMASHFFDCKIGKLEIGAVADIILLDYRPPTPLSAASFPWHLQFGISSRDITSTIVGARPLMIDREILTMDASRVTQESFDYAQTVWDQLPSVQ